MNERMNEWNGIPLEGNQRAADAQVGNSFLQAGREWRLLEPSHTGLTDGSIVASREAHHRRLASAGVWRDLSSCLLHELRRIWRKQDGSLFLRTEKQRSKEQEGGVPSDS